MVSEHKKRSQPPRSSQERHLTILLNRCIEAFDLLARDPSDAGKHQNLESALYFYGCRFFELKNVPLDKNPVIDSVFYGSDGGGGVGTLQKLMRELTNKPVIAKKTYIATAFKYAYIDYQRNLECKKNRPPQSLDAPLGESDFTLMDMLRDSDSYTPFAATDDAAESRHAQQLLAKHLQKLSPRIREALEMRMDGLKGDEIAQRLNITESTVRWRIHHARAQLQESILESGDFKSYVARLSEPPSGRSR